MSRLSWIRTLCAALMLVCPSVLWAADGTSTGQFMVTPDGAATYSLPITVPPGTAGLEPATALQYSSNGGNGAMGVGWSLSGTSQISRCPENLATDGANDPVDFDYSDKLCFDGQRLISISGTYGYSGTEYRTEIETFAKIKQYGYMNSRGTYFRVWTKDGRTMEFGKGSAAFRLPGKNYALLWSVNRIADRVGNYMEFVYDQRTSGYTQLLTRINYTGNTATGLAPYNSLRFQYQSRPDVMEGYVAGAGVRLVTDRRLTAVQTYAGSSLVRDYRITYRRNGLRNQSIVDRVTECAGGDCLPATKMSWEGDGSIGFASPTSNGPATYVSSNVGDALRDFSRVSFADFNGDGRTDIYVIEGYGRTASAGIHISRTNGGFYRRDGPETYITGSDAGASHDIARTKFGDFNGDGLTDVYIVQGFGERRQDRIELNIGNGQFRDFRGPTPSTNVSANHYLADVDIGRIRIADFNGDGLDDVYLINGRGGNAHDTIYINNGNESFSAQHTGPNTYVGHSASSGSLSMARIRHGDFNGDGLPDVYVINGWGDDKQDWVYLNNGDATFGSAVYGPNTYITNTVEKGNNDMSRLQFGDFNGDGLTDVFRVNGAGSSRVPSSIYLSRGDGSFAPQASGPYFSVVSGGDGQALDINRIKLIDANGDGLTDIYSVRGHGGTATDYIYLNQGKLRFYTRSGPRTYVADGAGGRVDVNRLRFGDFNGDGKIDAYRIQGYGGSQSDSVFTGTTPSGTRLAKITSGLGKETTINYQPLTQGFVYRKGDSANYPEIDVKNARYVVYSHTTDGPSGANQTTSYKYEGLKVHLRGRGSLGFAAITVHDRNSRKYEKTEYAQRFPYTGMTETQTVSYGFTFNKISRVTNSLARKRLGSRLFPYVFYSRNERYDSNYNVVTTQGIKTFYDNYGNATRVDVYTYKGTDANDDRHVTETINVYNDNISSWLLGRLSRSTVTKSSPSDRLTRKSSFTYDRGNGLLKSEAIEPGSNKSVTTTYKHDLFGNRTSATVTGPDIQTRSSSTNYDARGQFPISVTNALGHTEARTFYTQHGGRRTLTGPNGLTTRWQYDPFGRLVLEDRPDDVTIRTRYYFCGSACPTTNGVFAVRVTASSGEQTLTVVDKSEQEVSRSRRGYDGTWVHVFSEYDNQGRLARQSAPFYEGDTKHWTSYQYDVLDRIVRQEAPADQYSSGGAVTRFEYDDLVTTQTDARGKVTVSVKNVLGQTLRVTDALGGTLRNRYDAYGNLLSVTDPGGNITRMTYDIRGNKIAMDDPDLGRWTYQYNALGELTQQTDARGATTVLQYDPIGRMTRRTEPDMSSSGQNTSLHSEWLYDSRWIGAPSQVSGPDGYRKQYFYNDLGLPEKTRTRIDGAIYEIANGYDSKSRLTDITYPTGVQVIQSYNRYGVMDAVYKQGQTSPVWELEHVDALGNIAMHRLGNGVSTLRAYDQSKGTLDSIISGKNNGWGVQSLTYQWDAMDCLLERADQNQGGLVERFQYDQLHRMTRSTLNGQTNLRIRYDGLGNITYKSGVGYYQYDDSPHAVTRVTSGPRTATYTYDANGNRLTGGGSTLTWTAHNKPRSISRDNGNRSEFFYAPDRARYQQIIDDGQGAIDRSKVITYIGGLYERHAKANGVVEHRHQFQAGGQTIAIYTSRSNGANGLRYLHRDHLGSVDVITDEAGNEVERFAYDAHGKRRALAWTADSSDDLLDQAHTTARGFTGHEHLDHLGLIHMNGRVFDPILGRFTSADPHIQFADNTQSYNRYSYVLGNLLSATDPSGFFLDKIGEFVKKYGRVIAAVAITVVTGGAAAAAFAAYGLVAGAAVAFAGGFTAGLVASRGDYNAALVGGVTAVAFGGVGSYFAAFRNAAGSLSTGLKAAKVIAHGVVGGVSTTAAGGRFSDGFYSAAFRQALSGTIDTSVDTQNADFSGYRVAAAAVVGGTASEIGGGKFANGAVTAAFARAFNDEGHQNARNARRPGLIERFSNYIADRFSLNFGADVGYGIGASAELSVDGQTLRDDTIQLKSETGKIVGVNARATAGLEIVKSGSVDGIYTTVRGCAVVGCLSGALDSQGDYSINISVGPVIGTPSFAATPGYSARYEFLPEESGQ